jgi:pimeloyl-ACP methyl ester carboxylesterase
MPSASIAGEAIHYERSGGEGPPLMLVHGSGGSLRHWPDSLRRERGIDVIALDLPGHGSSAGTCRRRVEDYAGVVSAAAEALGLADVVLAGHSLGGAVALVLGLREPPWLSRLALVGTGARLRVSPEIFGLLKTDFPAAVEIIGQWAFGPDPDPGRVAAFRRGLLDTGPDVLCNDYSACDRFDIMDIVDRIRLPALVVAADQDRLTPVKYGAYLRDRLADAEMAVIEGAGHMMALEKEAVFVETLLRFVLHKPPTG